MNVSFIVDGTAVPAEGGAMQFTRIPMVTTSRATDLVNAMIPPFAAQ